MKVENKTYIDDKEVKLIAEYYGNKMYLGIDGIYITYYDTVVAIVDSMEHINIDEEFKTVTNEEN